MGNKKITELDDLASPAGADILAIVDDVVGLATTKKVTATNLMGLAPVQSVAGRTGAVTLSHSDISGSIEAGALASTGEAGGTKFLREDGDGTCSFQIPIADVETPLTAALRGTDNPHIGGFANQSLKVIDNPNKSVVVVADADGNLDFVVKSDSSRIYLNTPSSRAEMTTGVSVVEDSAEPDIEITTTSGTYSLISGDSDALGNNGLPIRQGFNLPDIGANSAPLLISGGTIA
jgi:hypothetical protein